MRSMYLKFLFSYAWIGLKRNRRRSCLAIATVVLSVSVSIFAQAFANEIFAFWVRGATLSGAGDVQLHRKGAWEAHDPIGFSNTFSLNDSLFGELQGDKDILGFARRLEFEGLISSGDRSLYFLAMGLEPEREQIVSPRLANFEGSRGSFVLSGDKRTIVIGRGLADTLKVDVGANVVLSVQTVNNQLNAIDVVVGGVLNYPDDRISKRIVYTDIGLAEEVLQMQSRFSEVAIRLREGVLIDRWITNAKLRYGKLEADVHPWWEVFPPIRKIEQIWRGVVGAICFLLFFSTMLSILNMIVLTIGERHTEIGVLAALGARRRDIRRIFACESILVGVVGGVFGLLIGNLSVRLSGLVGIPLDNPLFEGIVLIYPQVQPVLAVAISAVAVFLAYAASIFPAHRAGSIEPIAALRGQQ